MKLSLFEVRLPDPDYPGPGRSVVTYAAGALVEVGGVYPDAVGITRLGVVDILPAVAEEVLCSTVCPIDSKDPDASCDRQASCEDLKQQLSGLKAIARRM